MNVKIPSIEEAVIRIVQGADYVKLQNQLRTLVA
jgi:hypothetical protein